MSFGIESIVSLGDNPSALDILAAVAVQCAYEENLLVPLVRKKPAMMVTPMSEHGNAWTFNDNLLLWTAYERWEQQQPCDAEIAQWKKRPNLVDYSFPYYVHQKHFAARRTLVGVRKHFFKLKLLNFGKVFHEHKAKEEQRATISIPKHVFREVQGDNDGGGSCQSSSDGNDEDLFSRISQRAAQRRKRKFIDSQSGTGKTSSEVQYLEIVKRARGEASSNKLQD
jgi:hypothetical protein